MLGENALSLWSLDRQAVRARADLIGPLLEDVLTPPTEDWFPLGDVHKPMGAFTS